jgi:hypothetical protein
VPRPTPRAMSAYTAEQLRDAVDEFLAGGELDPALQEEMEEAVERAPERLWRKVHDEKAARKVAAKASKHGAPDQRAMLEARLREALAARGLELHGDSALVENHIRSGAGKVKAIVDALAEMDFFFKHTGYRGVREAMYQADLSERREERRWGGDREIDALALSERAKREAFACLEYRRGEEAVRALPGVPKRYFGLKPGGGGKGGGKRKRSRKPRNRGAAAGGAAAAGAAAPQAP